MKDFILSFKNCKGYLKLIIVTAIGGIFLHILKINVIRILIRPDADGIMNITHEVVNNFTFLIILASILMFTIIGIYFRKRYSTTQFIKAATLLSIYILVIWLYGKFIVQFDFYFSTSDYPTIPVTMFTTIPLVLAQFGLSSNKFLSIIITLLSPYLFLLFCIKKTKKPQSIVM